MTDPRAQTARAVLDRFQAAHPETAVRLHPHRSDPSLLRKPTHGVDMFRIRLLPVDRIPAKFWNADWGYYEICVDRVCSAQPTGTTLGSVRFVQYPHQQVLGAGTWLSPVRDLLTPLASKQPAWNFQQPCGNHWKCFIFGPNYQARDHDAMPVEQAATDLAWIVRHTLDDFAALVV